ncbi:MAG: cytidine deaminase [Prolixibacteraceae bacterium]
MEKKEIKITVARYTDLTELAEADLQLIEAAREMAKKAYAPYSGFKVGAALRLANGTIVGGSNQENASSPVGSCAERTALFWAGANFPDTAPLSIAVTAIDQSGVHAACLSPCGLCRQSLLEAEMRFKQPIRVLLDTREHVDVLDDVKSLVPLSFDGNSLISG